MKKEEVRSKKKKEIIKGREVHPVILKRGGILFATYSLSFIKHLP
jgi:hypothetical protein